MTLFVDHDALRSEAARLSETSAYVDALAPSIPGNVDGGVGTAAILGIMSIFVESAGELSVALAGFGDAVSESADRYSEQDLAAADQVNAALWEEQR
ncbi:hypothetical protein QM797_14720 [Rhodococcus sp. IEGM 1381]|uniref:hypothetical protein n=1 Tax=Rhodococcus sp. IEGM 1381 TaxID=3047085 RepID=UPI0024B78F28|nr:hypothetical protein [Rhodococcus sp. IEGM 1381]MDI9895976.1 hypothetical protein [Rhodococcus sp. IEGM 1381]